MEQSLENLSVCPSCGSAKKETRLKCIDYTFSKKEFEIDACTQCGLLYTNPRPKESEIGKYYDNPEYVSHTDTQKGLMFQLYRKVKTHTLRQKRRLLESLTNDKTILDYGAGTGDFSLELSNNGWKVTAYEPDPKARQLILSKTNNVELFEDIKSIPDDSISIIVLWHVLEHVHQLNETIVQFYRILKPSGYLIIAVPNHKSFDAQFYKENWAAYDLPRHLYHFDYVSMNKLMENHGLKLTSIKPMWFDSFYVSLLSEKNKRSKNDSGWLIGWPIAAIIGMVSNLVALFATSRCSSITYILKKPN